MEKRTMYLSGSSCKSRIRKLCLAVAALAGFGGSLAAQPITIPGLVDRYCLDGNANDGVGTRHGVVHGAIPTTDRFGNMNAAYQFNGVADFIELPPDIWVAGDFSVSGWLYLDGAGMAPHRWQRFFEFGNGVDMDNVFFTPTMGTGTAPCLGVHECGTSNRDYATSGSVIFPYSQWVHVVVTLQGKKVTVYLNNTVAYTYTIAYIPCAVVRTQNYFGKSNFPADGYFFGKMDDITIFNRAITATEVNSLYRVQWCGSVSAIAKKGITDYTAGKGILLQNAPNPSLETTVIGYELPENKESATLIVSDLSGKVVKVMDLKDRKGSVLIRNKDLGPGLYVYALSVNGSIVDRKKMVLTGR